MFVSSSELMKSLTSLLKFISFSIKQDQADDDKILNKYNSFNKLFFNVNSDKMTKAQIYMICNYIFDFQKSKSQNKIIESLKYYIDKIDILDLLFNE